MQANLYRNEGRVMRNVVIVGGGYGGLKILNGLLSQALPEDVRITVIEKNPYHSLKTEFYTIVAGTAADIDVRMQYPKDERVQYIFREVEDIDVENETITVNRKTDRVISYDYLIIGLGCEDNYHGIDGADQYTQSVQTFSKARKAALAVGNSEAYSRVSIVGAGLSGIEVASEIRESRPDLNIRLLDRGGSVLKAFDKRIQAHVSDWFVKNDVEVLHYANVEYVEKDGVCNNGICYVNDVTIWTAGVLPHHLVRALPYEKDDEQRVIVNDYYQVPDGKNVYIVGDCASSDHFMSAQLAGQQGEHIAGILGDVLHHRKPKKPSRIKLKGSLGSLGSSDGFGNMYNRPMTGLLPRLAKSGVLWMHKRD